MADLKYYDVILKPVISEKSMNEMTSKKYTFLVHTDATKTQIKDAVEKIKELVAEGNVTHIRVRKDDNVILNLPMTAGAVGAAIGLAAGRFQMWWRNVGTGGARPR